MHILKDILTIVCSKVLYWNTTKLNLSKLNKPFNSQKQMLLQLMLEHEHKFTQ